MSALLQVLVGIAAILVSVLAFIKIREHYRQEAMRRYVEHATRPAAGAIMDDKPPPKF